MMYLGTPNILLITMFGSGVILWIAASIGPSLRLCSCTPQVAIFSNKIMLLREQDEVISVYVLNYSLLLLWGLSSVVIELAVGADSDFTQYFSAFFAFSIGLICAAVHMIVPCDRPRRSEAVTEVESIKGPLPEFKAVTARVVQLPDGTAALAILPSPCKSSCSGTPVAGSPRSHTTWSEHLIQATLSQSSPQPCPSIAESPHSGFDHPQRLSCDGSGLPSCAARQPSPPQPTASVGNADISDGEPSFKVADAYEGRAVDGLVGCNVVSDLSSKFSILPPDLDAAAMRNTLV